MSHHWMLDQSTQADYREEPVGPSCPECGVPGHDRTCRDCVAKMNQEPSPLTPEQIVQLRRHFHRIWARHGMGLGHGQCAWCGNFVVSQGGVRFPKPHEPDCGYVALCGVLGLAP